MRRAAAGICVISGVCLGGFSDTLSAKDDIEPGASRLAQNPGAVVSIFEEQSVLGIGGKFTIEPSVTYSHSNTTLVAVEGFTIIPAVVVGLINVSQAQRDTLVSALTLRYALSNRFQASIKFPYVRTEETVRERQAFEARRIYAKA